MANEWSPRNVLEVLGDEGARRILALVSERARSADAIAGHLEISQPTVYRRLDVLEDHDFVRERRRLDDDGHHYKVYESTLESVRVDLDDGEFAVDFTLALDPVESDE